MRRLVLCGFLLVVGVVLVVAPARADTINPGPIQLSIGPGPVQFSLGSGTIQVMMQGAQAPGQPPGTNMVMNINGNGDPPLTVPIEIVALSLQSVAPVTIGSSFFDVFVEISPGPPQSTGTINLNSNGTFDSFFDVFVEITFHPVGGGQDTVQTELVPMQLSGGWRPDILRLTGTMTCTGQTITRCQLPVSSTIPEPGTLVLLGTGLAAVFGVRIRKKTL